MRTEEDEKEIEATKAPLMEHLIELRSRLIKALVAFFITFIVCFSFAGDIYNVLIFPFEWIAGPENTKFIYTALLEFFWTKLKLAMFGAAFLSFPVIASADLHVRRARAFTATSAARSCRIWSRRRSSSRSARTVVYFIVMPLIVRFSLGMQQLGGAGRREDRTVAEGRRISRPDDVAGARLRRRVPASGDPDAARARRHPHLADAAREAALFHRRRVRHRRDPHPAGRDQPALARAAADGALRGLDLVGAATWRRRPRPRPPRRRPPRPRRRHPTRRSRISRSLVGWAKARSAEPAASRSAGRACPRWRGDKLCPPYN